MGSCDARALGLLTDVKVLDHAVTYLQTEFAKTSGNDHETRAALLHALSTRRAAGFEAANSLNRVRSELSDPALAYLALTFANLDRAALANELIGILAPRAKTEATRASAAPDCHLWEPLRHAARASGGAYRKRRHWPRWLLARVRPAGSQARWGGRLALGSSRRQWLATPQSQGDPRLACTLPHLRACSKAPEDRYKLTVSVNETTDRPELDGIGSAEGQADRGTPQGGSKIRAA